MARAMPMSPSKVASAYSALEFLFLVLLTFLYRVSKLCPKPFPAPRTSIYLLPVLQHPPRTTFYCSSSPMSYFLLIINSRQ